MRRVSRKRTLACIGVGLAAAVAAPLLSTVQAAPLYQHRVGRAHRHVSYSHILEQKTRGPSSGFWSPGESATAEPEMDHEAEAGITVETLDQEAGGVLWSIVADASLQHPEGAPRLQRKQASIVDEEKDDSPTSTRAERNPPTTSQQHKERDNIRRRRRRNQVTDKFVEDSTSAVLQEEGSAPTTKDEAEQGEGTESTASSASDSSKDNYEGYDVTAEIFYDNSKRNNSTGGDTTSSVVTTSSKLPDNSTSNNASSVQESIYQPLRIRAILPEQRDGGEFLTVTARRILLKNMLQPALLTWSAALRVEPVVGNLTVDEHQLFDKQTCGPGLDSGLPSPRVPSYHLEEGIPDTDMILYLSIGFTKDAVNMSRFFVNNSTSNSEKKTESDGDADEEDLQEMDEEGAPQYMLCSGDYVAAASYCSTDQYDRPTAAMLHICVDDDFFTWKNRQKTTVTIMHEVGHALGFNSRSMAHFRRPDGSPITPRVDGEIVETQFECTGPSTSRRNASVALPSEEILQFRTVRGGVRVAEIVTPSVLQVVRNHFDCQTLTGAELESGEYSPLAGDPHEQACIGDHWERRLFKNDLMNPVVDSVEYSPFISTITLAYFADSGWYQVDLSMAELAASWGRGAGCGFVEDTCIGEDGQVPPSNKPFFCTAAPTTTANGLVEEIDGCTPDLSRKASCSLGQYDTELPPEYQYFGLTYGGTVGGSDPLIDYCPTYTGFDNGLCSKGENAAIIQVNPIERFGRRNSRCLSGLVKDRPTALCLQIACAVEDRSLHVKIDGKWRLCKSKDHELKVFKHEYVVCPDPRRVCPTFYCHHDCLGTTGRCDYDTGACVCSWDSAATNAPSTYAPSTNAIDAFTRLESNTVTGVCKEKNSTALFGANRTMPHANSLLSDYYVSSVKALQNDTHICLSKWQLSLSIVSGILVIGAVLFWCFYLKKRGKLCWRGGNNNIDDSPPEGAGSVNNNKHKMIASVLVGMRIADTDGGASVAPTNETAASLCGLESSSSLCPSNVDNDDRSSLASEDVLEDFVDVLADPKQKKKPKYVMRKRRFKGLKFGRD